MANKSGFNKLRRMDMEERQRAVSANSALLSQLSPTEIALLFPDYFKRGTPDVGGFRAAISYETARKQAAATDEQNKKIGWLEQMRQQYSSTTATGNLKANQQEAYKAARAEGLSDSAARILVANMSGESLKNPGDHHYDVHHMSQGIVQWDPERAERIRKNFGAYPKDMSVAQQTKAAIWEMKTYYGKSWNALNDENLPSSVRMSTVVGDYERPADVGGAVTTRMQYLNGLNITEESTATQADKERAKQGATPLSPGGGQSATGGQTTGGMSFQVKSGYIVPKDNNLYDTRNSQQCATLGKAFNPAIGRSSGWTVVDGDIKAGQVVATKQYNNSGADRTGAGYHTGVALTAPNEKGDFLLLEQYNNSGGAKTRWVNKNSYPTGKDGGTTSWGLISSNGKVHDEISQEALQYGQSLGAPGSTSIGTNAGAPGAGGDVAPGVAGTIEAGPYGDGQTASLMQPGGMMPNLMGSPMNMMMGMMGMAGMGMQSATPLGLITTAMGFIMPLIGTFMGERMSGEGMGAPVRGYRRHGRSYTHHDLRSQHGHPHAGTTGAKTARSLNPANAPSNPKEDYMKKTVIEREAKKLGISPHHLTTAMLYESIGSLNPDRKGVVDTRRGAKAAVAKGAQDRFMGLIQFGAAEQNKYGVKPGMSFDEHMVSVSNFLRDKGLVKWLQKHPNATEEEKKIALYSTINAGGPDQKNWHKTDKRYGGSSTTIIQKTQNMFRDWGGRAEKLLASSDPATQFASARPTTGIVGPGVTTPASASVLTPQQMAQAPGFGEKLARFVAGSKGAEAAPVNATPRVGNTPVTPSTTAVSPNSMSIAATPAPVGKFPAASRNAIGAYSTPARNDIMYKFADQKVSAPPQITGTPGAMPAPGPAPDIASAQIGGMRQQMAAIAQQQSTPVMAQQPSIQVAPPQGFNPDHAMKQISQPMNTPSFQRAMFNINGKSTPGETGADHYDYGNAR